MAFKGQGSLPNVQSKDNLTDAHSTAFHREAEHLHEMSAPLSCFATRCRVYKEYTRRRGLQRVHAAHLAHALTSCSRRPRFSHVPISAVCSTSHC